MKTKSRFIYPFLFALILSALTFAYAAANTVPISSAGDGQATISGYTVSNIRYILNSTNPSVIDAVEFNLTGAVTPTTVRIKLVSNGGAWYTCSLSGSTWSCAVNGAVSVLAADQLQVVAAQ
ncbi:MAG: hypothetical protein WHV66_07070 [Anaerolineales bacterium]